jgi:Tfp pilus assembly protein PilF
MNHQHEQWFQQANQLQAAGRLAEAASLWQRLVQLAPGDWQARLNLANVWQAQAQYEPALEAYLLVLQQAPHSLSAKCNLAQLLKTLGEYAVAAQLLQEVLAQDAQHIDALSALSLVCLYLCQNDLGVDFARQAYALAPARPALAANLGLLLTQARQYEEAESVLSAAIARFGALPDLCWNRAIVRLYLGQYEAAWPDYEARFASVLPARHTALARFDPLRHHGGRVLLWAEQGLGDSIMMMQLLPELQQRFALQLCIEAPASLHALFAQLLPGAVLLQPGEQAEADAQLPMMSVPAVLALPRHALAGKPYLAAAADSAASWQQKVTACAVPGRRIGLVWSSGVWSAAGAANYNHERKSIPTAELAVLVNLPGVSWFALQPGCDSQQLPVPVIDLTAGIQSFADTAALIAALDGVVTVDTAVAHLAAAMGKPVWVLMRYEGAPFFGADDSMPWYREVMVIRQTQPGRWRDVLATCRNMIKSFPITPFSC